MKFTARRHNNQIDLFKVLSVSKFKLREVMRKCSIGALVISVFLLGVPKESLAQYHILSGSTLIALLRLATLARERRWMMQQELAAHTHFMEAQARSTAMSLAAIPTSPAVGDRFSSNTYGAQFSVPFGAYSGEGLVGLDEVTIGTSVPGSPLIAQRKITRGHRGLRYVSHGWNFEAGSMLKENYVLSNSNYVPPPENQTRCSVTTNFQLIDPNQGSTTFKKKGGEESCIFTLSGNTPESCAPAAPAFCNASRPTSFWSQDGQVALNFTNRNVPILLYPDGHTEQLSAKAANAYIPFNEGLQDFSFGGRFQVINGVYFTDKTTDRNGNVTTYNYDVNTGWLRSVIDPKGRETEFVRDPQSRVKTIRGPGPAGGILVWQFTWLDFNWNPAAVFPDIVCISGQVTVPCANSESFTTLTNLKIPDGRSFTFSYGPWGNLDTVTTPEGAATKYAYGNSNTFSFPLAVSNQPAYTDNLNRRRLTSITNYPQGLSSAGIVTQIEHDTTEVIAPSGRDCTSLNWITRTVAQTKKIRQGLCATGTATKLPDRVFAQELWQGNILLDATYYGNTGALGDGTTAVGEMYIWDNPANLSEDTEDTVPSKLVHKRDGVTWTETFDYELSNIPTSPRCQGCSSFRTTGNVTQRQVFNSAGVMLTRTITNYQHSASPSYLNRNLLRLPRSVQVTDGTEILARTDYGYDEYGPYPLATSFAPGLDTSVGSLRGNVTTVTQYLNPNIGAGPIATHSSYFDTGDVQKMYDANGNPPSTMSYDFGLCSGSHKTLTGEAVNQKGHRVTTVSDCYTGLVLSVTDSNNQSSYTQYDGLGRLVETAGPGDTLTPISGFIRAAGAPLNGGTVIGNNGKGPTTWVEYLSPGVINQQRVVSHAKDGTANGHYVKTFSDGLGRTIQVRTEVDPGTSSGNGESVATTEYDALGNVSKGYVTVFGAVSDVYVQPSASALATVSSYDVDGRVTSVRPPGLPASTIAYGSSNGEFSTTTTNGRGNQTIVYMDVLGRKVRTAEQSTNCSDVALGNWCVNTMAYDGAGRLISIADPLLNRTTFTYDGLGRKKSMVDPDMGTWTYDYDNNGNLTSQRDAKGQFINMRYDVLNRVKVKDLPPNNTVTGPEDSTFYYDGEQAP